MTLDELKAKRDRLIKAIGIASQQTADQSISYSADRAKELSLLDAEIAKLESQESGKERIRQIRMQSSTGLD